MCFLSTLSVTVNFICHLDSAKGGPESWVCLEGVSGRDWIHRLNKDCSYLCGWASSTPLRTWADQKGRGRVNWLFALAEYPSSLALGHMCFQFLGLWTQTGTYIIASSVSGLWVWTRTATSAFLGFQLANGRSLGLLSLYHHWSQLLIKKFFSLSFCIPIFISISIYLSTYLSSYLSILLALFLWRNLTNTSIYIIYYYHLLSITYAPHVVISSTTKVDNYYCYPHLLNEQTEI